MALLKKRRNFPSARALARARSRRRVRDRKHEKTSDVKAFFSICGECVPITSSRSCLPARKDERRRKKFCLSCLLDFFFFVLVSSSTGEDRDEKKKKNSLFLFPDFVQKFFSLSRALHNTRANIFRNTN